MFQRKTQRHCGCCSQCIDRRFAVAAAGLLAQDPAKDYVTDVFVGPRAKELDRAIAIDYVRHGIELAGRSANELAGTFNAEISRAVRYEPNRREAAQKTVAMQKRHGEAVVRVLEQSLRENVTALINGSLDITSLLRMVVARQHHPAQEQVFGDMADVGSNPRAEIAALKESLRDLHAKFDTVATLKNKRRPRRQPEKRATLIFAAVLYGLEGMKYCSFLKEHGLHPKGAEQGNPTYPAAYQAGNAARKKVQDEKSRAKVRMNDYSNAELEEAFGYHLRGEFDDLVRLLHSRNSQNASKSSAPSRPHQH
jgi:hypothetical protein